jgi:hypothetical protein
MRKARVAADGVRSHALQQLRGLAALGAQALQREGNQLPAVLGALDIVAVVLALLGGSSGHQRLQMRSRAGRPAQQREGGGAHDGDVDQLTRVAAHQQQVSMLQGLGHRLDVLSGRRIEARLDSRREARLDLDVEAARARQLGPVSSLSCYHPLQRTHTRAAI